MKKSLFVLAVLAWPAGGAMAQIDPAQQTPVTGTTPAPAATDNAAEAAEAAGEPEGDGRIVGGTVAGSNPWQVQIYSTHEYDAQDVANDCLPGGACNYLARKDPWERVHRCGGVYIGGNMVLTAAHCVKGPANFGAARRVRMGTQNISLPGADFKIAAWRWATGFINSEPFPHDIAMLRIEADTPAARRFLLKKAEIRILGTKPGDVPLRAGDRLRVTGWGRTLARRSGVQELAADGRTLNHMSPVLMQIGQTPKPSACANLPDYRDRIAERSICAVSDKPGTDSCNGDSGGPMTRAQGDERVLVGLVSWGKGCALPGMPAVYTDVTGYLAWIAETKAALSRGTGAR